MTCKLWVTYLFILLSLNLISTNVVADKLQDILVKHQQAIGDLSRWRELHSVTYELEIKEPNFEVQGVYRASRDGKMRIDIFSQGKQVFSEAYNGKVAWQWSPDMTQAKLIDGDKASALRHGIELPGHLFTLLDMTSLGHQLEYIGEEKRGEVEEQVNASVVLLTLKDGHQKYYVLDVMTGVILASRDIRAFHPDIDATKVLLESRPSNFKVVNGMNRAFRSDNYDLTNDQWLGTSKVVGFKTNTIIELAFFEPENAQLSELELLPFHEPDF